MELILVKPQCCPLNWGDPGPWGPVPASPKGVAEGSWSCLEKEFKNRHATQQMCNTSGNDY